MLGPRKLLVASLFALIALSHSAGGAAIGFKPAVNYPVGTKPVAVAAGDLNGDGNIDLAVVNSGDASVGDDGGVSILLGNGDGTFLAAVNIPAGKNPVSIAVADFNGDDRLDLAVVNFDGGIGNVGILLGNGNGTFQSPVDYSVASGPSMVVVGDFNSDHKPDLVVSASSLSVLLGNGDGTFQAHVDLSFGGQDVAVADFNGDGKADLAARTLPFVVIALGKGDGTFQPATVAAHSAGGITLGDFNGDGKIDVFSDAHDLFALPPLPKWVGSLLVGNGDGTFHAGVATGLDLMNSGSVFQGDFNGDGKLDVMKPDASQSAIFVWAGNGNGTFATSPITVTVGSSPIYLTTADLNGDKAPDVVVTNAGDNTISVLRNTVGTDFSISAFAASPSTVSPGQSATSTVNLSLLNAFDIPVSLACSVQPVQAGSPTCSLNPNSITFDAKGKASAQLTITAGTAVALLTRPSARHDSPRWHFVWLPVVSFALLGTGLVRDDSKKRTVMGGFVAFCLFTGLVVQSACGGSSSSRTQAYTVTVMATSGTTQRSTTVTLTVH